MPLALPSQTLPLPCDEPRFDPLIVTWAPGIPLVGEIAVIVGVLTVKATEFDAIPPCRTWAVPDCETEATLATICVSLQLTIWPLVVPNQTLP